MQRVRRTVDVYGKVDISPILLAAGTFPHVQAEDEFRTLLIVTCELLATFAGHELFQLVQLHFGFTMDTFIGASFRWNLSLADFAAKQRGTINIKPCVRHRWNYDRVIMSRY